MKHTVTRLDAAPQEVCIADVATAAVDIETFHARAVVEVECTAVLFAPGAATRDAASELSECVSM